MSLLQRLRESEGFEWDSGNPGKNGEKHGVADGECEQIFFNRPLVALPDEQYSDEEERIHVLGQTDAGRGLFLVCTLREERIRVISARDMRGRNERSICPMSRKRRFENEDEERELWSEHDSTERVDWTRAERLTLPKLKPSVKSISLRLPQSMLDQLRVLANKRDVPYQSLIKLFLAERIRKELDEDVA